MEKIFDLTSIRNSLNQEKWIQDGDTESRMIFIGTVFALMPSGKCYAPWSSNITDDEANQDEAWLQQAEEELATIGCWMSSGEGDPCDLFVGEWRMSTKE